MARDIELAVIAADDAFKGSGLGEHTETPTSTACSLRLQHRRRPHRRRPRRADRRHGTARDHHPNKLDLKCGAATA